MGMSKGYSSQDEGISTIQIKDNLSFKINNNSNGYNSLKKVVIHESTEE